MPDKISVKGLAEFNRSLKRLDADLPKALRVALNGSSDFLIAKATPLIPKRSGAAARSLKARSSRTAVRIAVGGKAAPWFPWLDFGGEGRRRGRPGARPFIKEGRYLYPTLRKEKDQFTKIMEQAIFEVARHAGLDVD